MSLFKALKMAIHALTGEADREEIGALITQLCESKNVPASLQKTLETCSQYSSSDYTNDHPYNQ